MKSLIKRLLFALLLLNSACYAAQVKTTVIYFGKDKAYLAAGEAQKLTGLKSADYVMLKGHTDNDGADAYNIDLSKKRVDAIKDYILNMDKGIKIETDYYGERQPVNANADEKEKTLNRRVEVTYISDPMLRITVPVQQFVIDNSKNQVITCKEGTIVDIPAGAFKAKVVTISISEHYRPDEIFAANLTTHSGKKPIETAGMINITIASNGKSVEPSKPLSYKFPRINKTKDFKVFSGNCDSTNNINWILPGTAEKPQAEKENSKNQQSLQQDSGYLSGSLYTGWYTADPKDSIVENVFVKLSSEDLTLVNGYLKDAHVKIEISEDGRITSVKDDYENKNNEAHMAVQKYIWSCLPKKFNPYYTASYIDLYFGKSTFNYYPITNYSTLASSDITSNNAKYEADYIVLSSTILGWINCDRFLSGSKIADYTVKTDTDASVRLVLKKYRSFFGTQYCVNEPANSKDANTKKFIFQNIPANEDILLISTKKVAGKLYLAMENAKTSCTPFTKFNYKEVTQAELAGIMKNLKM